MSPEKNVTLVAWNLIYDVMTRSIEPLTLFMLHPGDGQYNCLTLLQNNQDAFLQKLRVTINGENIHSANGSVYGYPKLYKKNKKALFDKISEVFQIPLAERIQRDCPEIKHLLKLLAINSITLKPTLYDSSNFTHLETGARNFKYYTVSENCDLQHHLPWWIVQSHGNTLAILNLETGIQINEDGQTFDLSINSDEAVKAISSSVQLMEFYDVIEETRVLLTENPQWEKRYDRYAVKITENIEFIAEVRRTFRQWAPLTVYLNTTSALNAKKSVVFDIRYLGQTVARLTGYINGKLQLSTKGFEKNNLKDFGCGQQLYKADWAGSEATEFRKFFKEKHKLDPRMNQGNEEHRLESLWLTELLKKSNKVLPYARAVEIGNVRFPMPTPLSASDHNKIKYSDFYGGGIDIFCRTGPGGSNTFLCIMELKDENKKTEPPKDALKQAIAYTTFIRQLLRSQSGQKWWNLFGFRGKMPKRLILYATCVMPDSSSNDYSFENMELKIDEDLMRLHYVYFKEHNNKILNVETSLVWS